MPFARSQMKLVGLGVALALTVGIGAGGLIGCGGGDGADANTAPAGENGATDGATTTADGKDPGSGNEPDCKEAGISGPPRNEGTCSEESRKFVVVNEDGTLELSELEVDLLDVQTTKSLSSADGKAKTAKGTYIVFTLDVTNTTENPAYFDQHQRQAFLIIEGNLYTQDSEVEKSALTDSFANQFEKIEPEESKTGTIAFDVPKSIAPSLDENGNLNFVNFSEEEKEGIILNTREMGTIRTYQ